MIMKHTGLTTAHELRRKWSHDDIKELQDIFLRYRENLKSLNVTRDSNTMMTEQNKEASLDQLTP